MEQRCSHCRTIVAHKRNRNFFLTLLYSSVTLKGLTPSPHSHSSSLHHFPSPKAHFTLFPFTSLTTHTPSPRFPLYPPAPHSFHSKHPTSQSPPYTHSNCTSLSFSTLLPLHTRSPTSHSISFFTLLLHTLLPLYVLSLHSPYPLTLSTPFFPSKCISHSPYPPFSHSTCPNISLSLSALSSHSTCSPTSHTPPLPHTPISYTHPLHKFFLLWRLPVCREIRKPTETINTMNTVPAL